MNTRHPRNRPTTFAAIVCTGIALVLSGAPAVASTSESEADRVADTVQSLGSIPQTGPIDEAGTFAPLRDGTLKVAADGAETTIEAGASPSVELTTEGESSLTVEGALPGDAKIAKDGTAVFASELNYSVVPLPQDDASVQIITVLNDTSAPERFRYDLSSATALNLEIQENGMVTILDDQGGWVGGVAVPWAFDAEGTAVPTRFEVEGSSLFQVVEHQSGNFIYPISADPYLGRNLWAWHSIDSYKNDIRVNLRLSTWGGQNQLPWILTGAGWDEALGRDPKLKKALLGKGTMRQQFDCHAFGSAFAGDWNLERYRATRTIPWVNGVAAHHCNW